jgi:hypothetical protein
MRFRVSVPESQGYLDWLRLLALEFPVSVREFCVSGPVVVLLLISIALYSIFLDLDYPTTSTLLLVLGRFSFFLPVTLNLDCLLSRMYSNIFRIRFIQLTNNQNGTNPTMAMEYYLPFVTEPMSASALKEWTSTLRLGPGPQYVSRFYCIS